MEGDQSSGNLPPRGPRKQLPSSDVSSQPQTESSESLLRPVTVPMALNRAETLYLSSSGDVMTCRDRNGPYPSGGASSAWSSYEWQEDLALLCCDAEVDDLSTSAQEANHLCSPWGSNGRGGLMGGAEVAVPLTPPPPPASQAATPKIQNSKKSGLYGGGDNFPPSSTPWKQKQTLPDDNLGVRAKKAFRSPPLKNDAAQQLDDAESIVPIKSFDYSHYGLDGSGNDMLPERKSPEALTPPKSPSKGADEIPDISHGVPTFMPGFAQVKVKQISAHPLGSHVLLISDVNLLYSYGLNDYGQLGIGIQTPKTIRYIMHPNIVTPLAEHGGKAILCAAGVSHSLVVVATEERRLIRSQSMEGLAQSRSPPSNGSSENGGVICNHQLYGFGRNDFTKIGLVSPKIAKSGSGDEMERVTLPHRVALRCKVRPEIKWPQTSPPQGIFSVAASAEHSAALVRRSTGDVELYTWGNAMFGALGLPPQAMQSLDNLNDKTTLTAVKLVPVPSFVASLSRTSNEAARNSSVLTANEYPVSVSLGRRSSLVLTSTGRCFSFGCSDNGELGLGEKVVEVQEPSEISMPDVCRNNPVVSISVGAAHTVAVLKCGRVLAWGRKANAGLSFMGADLEQIAWTPELIQNVPSESDTPEETAPMRIIHARAGYDSVTMVSSSGKVLSCGRGSGRLGLGEITEEIVRKPQRLFGGLQLWHRGSEESAGNLPKPESSPPRPPRHKKSFSQRNLTLG